MDVPVAFLRTLLSQGTAQHGRMEEANGAFACSCHGVLLRAASLRAVAAPPHPPHPQVPSAVFCQPPLGTVGMTEEKAIEKLSGEVDVYVSKFKPMKNTLRCESGAWFWDALCVLQAGWMAGGWGGRVRMLALSGTPSAQAKRFSGSEGCRASARPSSARTRGWAGVTGLALCPPAAQPPRLCARRWCSGRDERTFMKMIVHVPTNRVVGCHMVSGGGGVGPKGSWWSAF